MKCRVCGKPVPPDRRAYCGDECYKASNNHRFARKREVAQARKEKAKFRKFLGK
jgi:predicted nucleic acid-binding Zn ribbon protein